MSCCWYTDDQLLKVCKTEGSSHLISLSLSLSLSFSQILVSLAAAEDLDDLDDLDARRESSAACR